MLATAIKDPLRVCGRKRQHGCCDLGEDSSNWGMSREKCVSKRVSMAESCLTLPMMTRITGTLSCKSERATREGGLE